MKPRIVDTFLFNDEFDMLECRLTEIGDIVDHVIIVESPVTFQGDSKPLHFTGQSSDRWSQWADKITVVVADEMPEGDDPWQREYAQREYVLAALEQLDLADGDLILHGDVDEIPRPLQLRNIRPSGFACFGMRFHPFAVDWIHPEMWRGTVVGRWSDVRRLGSVTAMRNLRFTAPVPLHMADAGWHLSWVGSLDYQRSKLRSFSHTEIIESTAGLLDDDHFRRSGVHVDGVALSGVDVDLSWPRWVVDGRAPVSWFRPRAGFHEDWFSIESQATVADLAASTVGLDGLVVEVGSWEGRSTIALADAVAPAVVHAVDTWVGCGSDDSGKIAAGRDVFATFELNIAERTAGNVVPHRMGWRDYFADLAEPIRFLFIDAEHTYDEVRDNIAAALPLMLDGGVICGDDGNHPPVRAAVVDVLGDEAVFDSAVWHWRKRG